MGEQTIARGQTVVGETGRRGGNRRLWGDRLTENGVEQADGSQHRIHDNCWTHTAW